MFLWRFEQKIPMYTTDNIPGHQIIKEICGLKQGNIPINVTKQVFPLLISAENEKDKHPTWRT
jgi:hypothetical protein